MPGEPTTTGRFDTPLPPQGKNPPIRQPSDSPENIIDENNDATGGTIASAAIEDDRMEESA